ncbi:MAG TPA: hypothetical protein DCR62_01085 [Acholeplasmatales bacterium]|jgi:hypothetical protein|nr:hypothetical protein [Bacilli bacterium]MBS6562427.1 hypothetical protein [Staphylococcus sp.]CDC70657.1 unknown [Staphylococcus sp. CAG:324]HAR57332.1 hypothetical protein [Acholeplasmatales bacterium]
MKKVKNLDLIIILVAITILGIITAIVLAIRPYEVKKFDKITHVNIDNYKTIKNNKEEYFVLLYDSNNTKYELLEECVVAYAEFARNNKDVPNIYVIDYRSNKEIINSSNFNINDVKLDSEIPCLAKITTSGSLTNKKKNISDICNLLEDYMSGKEQ